jgi:hypothetical protein
VPDLSSYEQAREPGTFGPAPFSRGFWLARRLAAPDLVASVLEARVPAADTVEHYAVLGVEPVPAAIPEQPVSQAGPVDHLVVAGAGAGDVPITEGPDPVVAAQGADDVVTRRSGQGLAAPGADDLTTLSPSFGVELVDAGALTSTPCTVLPVSSMSAIESPMEPSTSLSKTTRALLVSPVPAVGSKLMSSSRGLLLLGSTVRPREEAGLPGRTARQLSPHPLRDR